MKYYLYTDSIDWADEFNVTFGSLIDEKTYLKYTYAQEVLDSFKSDYYFGTNEGWDDDFDYLSADFTEVSDSEADVLQKFKLPQGEDIVEYFFYRFEDAIDPILYKFPKNKYPDLYKDLHGGIKDWVDLYKCSLETFKEIVDEYKNYERKS